MKKQLLPDTGLLLLTRLMVIGSLGARGLALISTTILESLYGVAHTCSIGLM
jgi:hypothetical protein